MTLGGMYISQGGKAPAYCQHTREQLHTLHTCRATQFQQCHAIRHGSIVLRDYSHKLISNCAFLLQVCLNVGPYIYINFEHDLIDLGYLHNAQQFAYFSSRGRRILTYSEINAWSKERVIDPSKGGPGRGRARKPGCGCHPLKVGT